MATNRSRGEAPTASWLDPDSRCDVCLQVYSWELEVRCHACDGPLCPFCAVRETLTVVTCPSCCETSDEEGG